MRLTDLGELRCDDVANAGAVDVEALLRSLYVDVSHGELVVEQHARRSLSSATASSS